MLVAEASPVHPAGTPAAPMVPPVSDTQPTSRSPWATLAGLGILSVVAAVVLVAWLTDSRTMPAPPPGGLDVTLQVCVAGVGSVLPAGSVAQTLNVWDATVSPA